MRELRAGPSLLGAVLAAALLAGCGAGHAGAGRTQPPARATGSGSAAGPSRGSAAAPAGPSAIGSRAAPARRASAATGRLVTRTIRGTTSRFGARAALIWLPPILRRQPAVRLPVLELLPGTPSDPRDWATKGAATQILDAFAATHGGRAPIVVMPDINGSHAADTECITTSGGADVERYLTVDVPRWVRTHFPTVTGRRWSIAGLSEGGMCSAMLALRHPTEYGVFGDFSGLSRPTVGDTDDPATTLRVLFHGSRAAYDRHDLIWLLRRHRYPSLAGWIEYGTGDARVRTASSHVAAAARAAGVTVREVGVPGGHSWTVWTSALRAMLPWLWGRAA